MSVCCWVIGEELMMGGEMVIGKVNGEVGCEVIVKIVLG